MQNILENSKLSDIETKLRAAQEKTWQAVHQIVQQIQPGMSELEAIKVSQKVLLEMGTRKFWHKSHVRFGVGTRLGFNDSYEDNRLKSNDIFYIDIGPIWDGIEGDAGATFTVGNAPKMQRCADDAKAVFAEVQKHWEDARASGIDLYNFAGECAKKRGWILSPSYVKGHRLSEFPHSFYAKVALGDLDFHPAPGRWVLEIQICDPELKFGAFYEDVLF